MKKFVWWVLLSACLAPQAAGGQTLSVSADPQPLVVRFAVAGFAADAASDQGTTYNISVTKYSDVWAQLDAPLPAGVQLRIRISPPAGGTSSGAVLLSTSAERVLAGVPPGSYAGLSITYELIAAPSAGVLPPTARQITFSVVSAQ